ncbi:MAG: FGGY-family carbohydrate kinase [Planctomycetota bacterium]
MGDGLTGRETLAIDAGTQGVSLILWCPKRRAVLGVGERPYARDYLPGLPEGRLEQSAEDWTDAIRLAMADLREDVRAGHGVEVERVAGIGVTGHMHCMVRIDANGGKPFGCDMWNDPRGVAESAELTDALGEHVPARWTGCHILARMRSDPAEWGEAAHVTVTSGSIVHDLTGEHVIGPGDATGMFGSLGEDGQIDRDKLATIDRLGGNVGRPLGEMVPRVVAAGEVAATLSEAGGALLGGLPAGTPVAAPEGDQQSVLVVAAVDELELALSAGTSFSGNLPTRAHVKAKDEAVNVLATPDGLTMLMVCARNGTVGFAEYVKGLAALSGKGFAEVADALTDGAVGAGPEAGGATLWGFFQGENVTEMPDARATMEGAGIELLSNPGLMARLLLESPCLTMRYGLEQLKADVGSIKRVALTGGMLKSKGGFAGQMVADVLGVPVDARAGDEEGTAKGAAILAAYMALRQAGDTSTSLADFAKTQVAEATQHWTPDPAAARVYDERYARFARGVAAMQEAGG